MPLVPLVLVFLVLVGFVIAMPLALVQRYRLGKARRPARKWLAAVNLALLALSAVIFLWVAALTNFWVPNAFSFSLMGLGSGAALGILGLALTRWERTARTVHYTPNRWLVLLLTFAVAARLLYGLWRGWHAWGARGPDTSWLAASGLAGSLAVGAALLGYYLVYSAGVLLLLGRHRKRWAQPL